MSELNYGDNVEHLLYELSQYYEGEVKGSFEIRGETEDGIEGYEYIEVSLLADDAVNLIAELKAQRDALTGENAAMKRFISESCYSYDGDGSDISDSYIGADQSPWFPKTPATDAYMNSVRAEGVEMFAHFWESNCGHEKTFIGSEAKAFAAQLSLGEPS